MVKRIIRAAGRFAAAHREQVSYLVFGVLTTLVNYGVFLWLRRVWGERWDLLSNLIAFAAAVAFAYVTNKQFVFRSRDWKPAVVFREVRAFTAARVFSFLVEEAGLFLASNVLHLEQYKFLFDTLDGVLLAKAGLNVIVVILNYVFSKLLVFRHSEK